MLMERSDRDLSRSMVTLACATRDVLLWPGIPLTHRRGGEVVPFGREVIIGRLARLHGPGAASSAAVWAIGRAAAHLSGGETARADGALLRAGLPRVTPDGHRLMRAVALCLGLPLPDVLVRDSPRLWSPSDIDRFARLHAIETVAAWDELAKFGFNPDEARDPQGRWTMGSTGGCAGGAGSGGTGSGGMTVIAGTTTLLRSPAALEAAIVAGEVVLETAAAAAAALTPVGWAVIGAVAIGGVAYLVYRRTTAALPPPPHLPSITPGRSATPLPPIQPPGFPASPPITLPSHTGSPAEIHRPQILTSPAEPIREAHEIYVGLSPEELAEMEAAHAVMAPEELDRVAGEVADAAKDAKSPHDTLQALATAADRLAKGNTAHTRGTNAHLLLDRAIKILNDRIGFGHATEASYKDGEKADDRPKGSIRVDIVVGDPEQPEQIYEYKTGRNEGELLSPRRVRLIRKHLPEDYKDIPIHKLRPEP